MATQTYSTNVNIGNIFIGFGVATLIAQEINVLPTTMWYLTVLVSITLTVLMIIMACGFSKMVMDIQTGRQYFTKLGSMKKPKTAYGVLLFMAVFALHIALGLTWLGVIFSIAWGLSRMAVGALYNLSQDPAYVKTA